MVRAGGAEKRAAAMETATGSGSVEPAIARQKKTTPGRLTRCGRTIMEAHRSPEISPIPVDHEHASKRGSIAAGATRAIEATVGSLDHAHVLRRPMNVASARRFHRFVQIGGPQPPPPMAVRKMDP